MSPTFPLEPSTTPQWWFLKNGTNNSPNQLAPPYDTGKPGGSFSLIGSSYDVMDALQYFPNSLTFLPQSYTRDGRSVIGNQFGMMSMVNAHGFTVDPTAETVLAAINSGFKEGSQPWVKGVRPRA